MVSVAAARPHHLAVHDERCAGIGAAAGIALINSLGNLARFASPYAVGWLKDATGSTDAGVYLLAMAMVLGAALTLPVPKQLENS